jgi:RNA-directed DNA polymerase
VWLAYQPFTPGMSHYHYAGIPKRQGGTRQIAVPKRVLADVQLRLLRDILRKVEPHPAATAFRTGASIVDHAGRHTGQGVVIRLDLSDSFHSITRPRVTGLFASLGYNPGVATVLSLLVTERPRMTRVVAGQPHEVFSGVAHLPQGACTSPAISNLICRRLDARLSGLANRHGFTYSRYADDLTFSHPAGDVALGRLLASAGHIVRDEGFILNDAKTRVMRRNARQTITGLTVNDGVSIPRADLRRFRATLHACERDGFDVVSQRLGRDARAYVHGYLAYVAMVDHERAAKLRAAYSSLSR